MSKKIFTASLIIFSAFASMAQVSKTKSYKFTIDLLNVNNDKITVDLITPLITQKTITYHLPKIVPGTYSEDDYGRYVEQFTAFDKLGHSLSVTRIDTNSGLFPMLINYIEYHISSTIRMMIVLQSRQSLSLLAVIFKKTQTML